MSVIKAEVVEASGASGVDLITLQLRSPKFLDAEFEKHRMICSNSSSDRAIPFEKMIEQDYYLPSDVRLNEPGMQGYSNLEDKDLEAFRWTSRYLRNIAISTLDQWKELHKQTLNRFLLPWSMQSKVATATRDQWEYFLSLRLSQDADPAMQELASKIEETVCMAEPQALTPGQWHLPYVTEQERKDGEHSIEDLKNISVARCARVSYNNHDGTACDVHSDLNLASKLKENKHHTPFEHQATPMVKISPEAPSEHLGWDWEEGITSVDRLGNYWSANFRGWLQNRQL